jgi:hypothetical protein
MKASALDRSPEALKTIACGLGKNEQGGLRYRHFSDFNRVGIRVGNLELLIHFERHQPRQVGNRFQVDGSELIIPCRNCARNRILSNTDTAIMAVYTDSFMSSPTPARPVVAGTLIAIDKQTGGFLRESVLTGLGLASREGKGKCVKE